MIDPEKAARSLELAGPDQYPTGFYRSLVAQKIAQGEVDWQKKFAHIYEALMVSDTDERAIDRILDAFRVEYHIAKSGD